MERRPTTQDITWLLDLDRNKQLDLEPPYQRRSVWTAKDRRFFLDTIFRNYPSPAIFLHKNIDDDGAVKYFVVDGKQRLETILGFTRNKIRMAADYGDLRLDGKLWRDISDEIELKHRFWNYQITVEMIDAREGDLVRNVFDRLNRNSRRLSAQELRHARYEGWLITKAEEEADSDEWSKLGVSTKSRSNRMVDVQFISELMAVVMSGRPLGFSQDDLDALYGEYEDLHEVENFDVDGFIERFALARDRLTGMQDHNGAITTWAKGFGHIYTLWCLVALRDDLPSIEELADRYAKFMSTVEEVGEMIAGEQAVPDEPVFGLAMRYRENARGASTEEAQRVARLEALSEAVL